MASGDKALSTRLFKDHLKEHRRSPTPHVLELAHFPIRRLRVWPGVVR